MTIKRQSPVMRTGTAAEQQAAPPLVDGQLGYALDTNEFKVGDGTTAWDSLESANRLAEQIQDIVGAMVTGNTETGGSLSYDDAGGKINLSVP